MKIASSDLGSLIKASYNDRIEDVGRFSIISHLSDNRVKVYTNPDGPEILVVHRGSADSEDWKDNLQYNFTGSVKNSGTYKKHLLRHKRVVAAHGAENIVAIGHSRGGLYVDQLHKDKLAGQAITYNKPVHLKDIVQSAIIAKPKDNTKTDVRTEGDAVSAGQLLLKGPRKTVTVKNDSINPLAAHGSDKLQDVPDKMVGQGVPPPPDALFQHAIDFRKLRVKDLRAYVKANRYKLPERVNITRLTKPEMVELTKILMAL